MSNYLNKVVYLTDEQYATLVNMGSISINGQTQIYDANTLYITKTDLTTTSPSTNGTATEFITSISQDKTGKISATKASLATATTNAYGATKLYDDVDSTSNTLAATANAVKIAYDKANSITAASLGLSQALKFKGTTSTTDIQDEWTGTPAGIYTSPDVPQIGDVVLDSNNDAEYVCISTTNNVYTWELLGRSGSWAPSTHTHDITITDGGTSTKTLTANTVYTLSAGGQSITFTTPVDNNIIPCAYCDTAAGTQKKIASCTNYTLTNNTWIPILIKNANSYNGKITLNINGKGEKDIWIDGTVSSSSNKTLPAGTYLIYYDGSKYLFRTDGVLPGSAPASDVYAWAKAATKPTYTYDEVGAAESSHDHGNITNDGKIGSTANLAVYTTTGGALTAGTLATDAPTTSGTATAFITSISQDSKGKISASKALLDTSDIVKKKTTLATSLTTLDIMKLEPGMYDHISNPDNALPTNYGTVLNIAGLYQYGSLIAAESNHGLYYRSYRYASDESYEWRGNWQMVAHSDAGTQKGSATKPIYISNTGLIQEGTALKNLAYIDKPSDNTTTTWLRGDGTWVAPPNDNTASAVDNILNGSNSGTAITYQPYTSHQTNKLSFDTSTTNPDGEDRLNLNGYLYATKLYSQGAEVLIEHNNLVKQTAKDDNAKYKLLASANTSPQSGNNYEAVYDTKIYINPSLNTINAGGLVVHDKAATPVEKVTLQWNSTDQSLDFIFA